MPAWQVVCNDYENNPHHWGYCIRCGFIERIHDDYDGASVMRGGIHD